MRFICPVPVLVSLFYLNKLARAKKNGRTDDAITYLPFQFRLT